MVVNVLRKGFLVETVGLSARGLPNSNLDRPLLTNTGVAAEGELKFIFQIFYPTSNRLSTLAAKPTLPFEANVFTAL
jgi:hypothetical protein